SDSQYPPPSPSNSLALQSLAQLDFFGYLPALNSSMPNNRTPVSLISTSIRSRPSWQRHVHRRGHRRPNAPLRLGSKEDRRSTPSCLCALPACFEEGRT